MRAKTNCTAGHARANTQTPPTGHGSKIAKPATASASPSHRARKAGARCRFPHAIVRARRASTAGPTPAPRGWPSPRRSTPTGAKLGLLRGQNRQSLPAQPQRQDQRQAAIAADPAVTHDLQLARAVAAAAKAVGAIGEAVFVQAARRQNARRQSQSRRQAQGRYPAPKPQPEPPPQSRPPARPTSGNAQTAAPIGGASAMRPAGRRVSSITANCTSARRARKAWSCLGNSGLAEGRHAVVTLQCRAQDTKGQRSTRAFAQAACQTPARRVCSGRSAACDAPARHFDGRQGNGPARPGRRHRARKPLRCR